MKERIIRSYIRQLTKDDIVMCAKKNGIILENCELDIIYDNIKNNYDEILSNPIKSLNDIKPKLTKKTYDKLYELYTIYYPKLYH